jgi:tetratricopeptide (TPR) repeat protein
MGFATNRGAAVSVAAALVLLFSFTTVLNSAYHATRRNRAEARYQHGLALAGAGQHAAAAEEFRAALTYEHADSRFTLGLARSLMELGRWTEAETYLGELREEDPTDGPVNLMLARIAAREHRDSDAVIYYQRALYGYWSDHAEENRIAARFELVTLLDRGHQDQPALGELLHLAAEVPAANSASRRVVAQLLLAHGAPQQAEALFHSILSAHPHDAATEEGLADAHFAMGDYATARRVYLAAHKDGAADAASEQRLAVCESVLELDPTLVRLSAAERSERARELLRRVVDSVSRCAALPPDLAAAAQSALAEKGRRQRQRDSEELLTLAAQIWKARQDLCGRQAESGGALNIVIAKIQTQ